MVRVRRVVAGLSLLLVLAACGGGGGGSSSSSGGGGGGSAVTTSGLVPAAPVPGAVITADAAVLRPIRDAAVWTYAGTSTAYTGAAPIAYVTRTTQLASSATAADESYSNGTNTGPSSQPVAISGGVVGTPLSIDFAGKGTPEQFQFVELRSPVRQDDQYTMLDRHYSDTDIDADGDRKPDALDVAIYGRVMGAETLSLPGLPSLSTVRIDITVRSRVTYSTTGQTSQTIVATIQTWYARGIGIVRQRGVTPAGSGGDNAIADEQLSSWDGITEGFGAMPSRPAVVPSTSAELPGQVLPGDYEVRGGAVFGDHALVVTAVSNEVGAVITRLDTLGRAVSAHAYADLPAGKGGLFLPHAQGLLYLIQTGSSGVKPTVALTRFDADGVQVGNAGGVTIDLRGPRTDSIIELSQATIDGTTLWLLWPRIYNTPTAQQRELILRPFTLDGVPLGPELIVDPVESAAEHIVGVGGRVLLTWRRYGNGYEAVYASVALGDASVTVRPFADGMDFTTSVQLLLPAAGGPQGLLLWTTPLPDTPPGTTAGVVLDAGQAPVRAGSSLGNEVLPGVPMLDTGRSTFGATPDRSLLVLSQTTALSWLAPNPITPLSATRISQVGLSGFDFVRHLVFGDRVILLGGNPYQLSTTVVWLNSGQPL